MSAQPRLLPQRPETGPSPFERDEEGRWTVLSRAGARGDDPLAAQLGAPGLWRPLPAAPDAHGAPSWREVFELPPEIAGLAEEGVPDEPPLAALLAWAEATSGGSPPGVATPPAEEVESWIAPARRHVRAGAHVVPISLEVAASRLALRVPSLVHVPDGLAPARRAWLRALCLDAQLHWRWVRFGWRDREIVAEVDLSGAPPACARRLLEIGLAALAHASAWVLPALALVVDEDVGSRLLDRPPDRNAVQNHPKGGSA